jgi:hypothetical protein
MTACAPRANVVERRPNDESLLAGAIQRQQPDIGVPLHRLLLEQQRLTAGRKRGLAPPTSSNTRVSRVWVSNNLIRDWLAVMSRPFSMKITKRPSPRG